MAAPNPNIRARANGTPGSQWPLRPRAGRFLHQSTSLPSCDGDGALGCYPVPSDAAKHDLAVAAADADAAAACDEADLLLQVAGVDRDLHVEHADQLHALIKH